MLKITDEYITYLQELDQYCNSNTSCCSCSRHVDCKQSCHCSPGTTLQSIKVVKISIEKYNKKVIL